MPKNEYTEADRSNGYEAVADEFIKRRKSSRIGVATVRRWAKHLPPGATILDLGCGSGVPIAHALNEDGFRIFGVDASLSMVQAFRKHIPHARVAHESIEESTFFDREFNGVIAWGLMFLLAPEIQIDLIQRVSQVLIPGGRFLFTSPEQECSWVDILTGKESVSLGADVYQKIARRVGLELVEQHLDEGDNHYFSFVKL